MQGCEGDVEDSQGSMKVRNAEVRVSSVMSACSINCGKWKRIAKQCVSFMAMYSTKAQGSREEESRNRGKSGEAGVRKWHKETSGLVSPNQMEANLRCVSPTMAAEKRGPAHKSRTHRLLGPHKQAEGWNVLALSNGRWKLPDDHFGAFLEHYVSDLPGYKLGLVVKKSEYFPYIIDVDKSATKGASVGSPMEVLKVVVRALKSVVGETRLLFEHRNHANFHVLCPDIIVNSRTAVRIREKQLAVLTLERSEVDWGDIVDERVLTTYGLRLLGSLKFKEIPGAKDSTKRYKEVKADIAGDIALCLIRAVGNGLQHSPGERVLRRASRRRLSDLAHSVASPRTSVCP